jgi:hypothetical protein
MWMDSRLSAKLRVSPTLSRDTHTDTLIESLMYSADASIVTIPLDHGSACLTELNSLFELAK